MTRRQRRVNDEIAEKRNTITRLRSGQQPETTPITCEGTESTKEKKLSAGHKMYTQMHLQPKESYFSQRW
ncbi:hypothetical protein CEXT_544911 [Caerostris extrusa]|uniref:Uncharacterized protein n=1 Tax=Caerostris extrusa TaxID=172846 RepID=A0AAV4N2S0_CAEEX|nr:hypothetical protein CEXT_544911 [Caerostris extrusa]